MVGELYGVPLSVAVPFFERGSNSEDEPDYMLEVAAKPSHELLEKIAGLPRGARVAVDEHSPTDTKRISGVRAGDITIQCEPDKYWEHIIEICRMGCMEVVYLQDADLTLHNAAIANRQEALNTVLEEQPDNESLQRASYVNTTAYRYFSTVKRLDSMLSRISKAEPAVSVLSYDYANSAFMFREELFSRYYRESFPHEWVDRMAAHAKNVKSYTPDALMRFCNEHIPNNDLVSHFVPSEDTLDYRGIGRAYKGATEHRITDGKPHFMGNFDWEEMPFEIFVTGKIGNVYRIRIEDIDGTYRGWLARDGEGIEIHARVPYFQPDEKTVFYVASPSSPGVLSGKLIHPKFTRSFQLRAPLDRA